MPYRPPPDGNAQAFIYGLNQLGVVWVQLVPGEKRSTRNWGYFLRLHEDPAEIRYHRALAWLAKGYGLGFLPRGGLWVLDCDAPGTISRTEACLASNDLHAVRVDTPSGGAHFYFQYPEGFDHSGLKNHVCHPKEGKEPVPWDFKLGERTLVVAPGTAKKEGSYQPSRHWEPPPEAHPRLIAPHLEIYKSKQPFLVNERELHHRIVAGQNYIKRCAPVSVETKGGRGKLRQVAAHLVAYLRLDPALAYHMLVHRQGDVPSWNSRCVGPDGNPAPWAPRDLLHALNDAVDAVPAYGVRLYEERCYREELEGEFHEFLGLAAGAAKTNSHIFAEELHEAFTEFRNGPTGEFGSKLVGERLSRAMRTDQLPVNRCLKGKERKMAYRGIDSNDLRRLVVEHRQGEINRFEKQ